MTTLRKSLLRNGSYLLNHRHSPSTGQHLSPIRSCLSALATWRAPLPAVPPGLCEAVPHLFLAGFTPVPSFCSRLSPKQLISGRELALPIWGSGRGPGQSLTCCFWSLSAQEQPWTRGAWTLVSRPRWAGVRDKSLVIGSGGCSLTSHEARNHPLSVTEPSSKYFTA